MAHESRHDRLARGQGPAHHLRVEDGLKEGRDQGHPPAGPVRTGRMPPAPAGTPRSRSRPPARSHPDPPPRSMPAPSGAAGPAVRPSRMDSVRSVPLGAGAFMVWRSWIGATDSTEGGRMTLSRLPTASGIPFRVGRGLPVASPVHPGPRRGHPPPANRSPSGRDYSDSADRIDQAGTDGQDRCFMWPSPCL